MILVKTVLTLWTGIIGAWIYTQITDIALIHNESKEDEYINIKLYSQLICSFRDSFNILEGLVSEVGVIELPIMSTLCE